MHASCIAKFIVIYANKLENAEHVTSFIYFNLAQEQEQDEMKNEMVILLF